MVTHTQTIRHAAELKHHEFPFQHMFLFLAFFQSKTNISLSLNQLHRQPILINLCIYIIILEYVQ